MSNTPSPVAVPDEVDCQRWVERHGDYLYRYALRTVRRDDAAEDLVQDTLLAAWRGRAGFAGRSSERSWLTAILKRKVIDWLRAAVRERARTADTPADDFEAGLFDDTHHWRKRPKKWANTAPDADATRAEFWEVVRSCSGKLPPRLRDVFVLRHLEESEAAEICQRVAITPSNLWVMLHRARLRMWRCLTENWYGLDTTEPKAGGE
jgi:RNA polymerase sigma-70 factor (ECF subfamily)